MVFRVTVIVSVLALFASLGPTKSGSAGSRGDDEAEAEAVDGNGKRRGGRGRRVAKDVAEDDAARGDGKGDGAAADDAAADDAAADDAVEVDANAVPQGSR